MKHRTSLLVAFPIFLLSLFGLERIASYLLGKFPAAPELWMVSLQLRTLFRECANAAEAVTGHSITLQILIVIAAICLVAVATLWRRGMTISFIANHAALIAGAVMMAVEGAHRVATSDSRDWTADAANFGLAIAPNWLNIAVLAAGIFGCAYCHWCFWNMKRRSRRTRAFRLKELRFNI